MKNTSIKTKNNEILNGDILKNMLLFALPLAISSMLQQLFNAIDMAVVGLFASSQDQAAVGGNAPLINLMLNLFVGISVGANVVIATYVGQNHEEKIKSAVHTAIPIAMISGLLLVIIGFPVSGSILRLMNTPDDTIELASTYLRIYLIGMPFAMVYNFGASILRAIGDSKRPMYILIATGVLNAILNVILVIGFGLGVAGVAIATVTANIVNCIAILYILSHESSAIKLDFKELRISRPELIKMLKIGLPSGLQGMVFSVANVFIQSTINGFGSAVVAGSADALNCEYTCYFVVNSFNQAVMTFTGQNYGAHNFDRCKKIYRVGLLSSTIASGLLAYTFILFRYPFMSLFTNDPEVIEYGATRIVTVLTLYFILNSYEISGSAMRGLGHSLTPAILTVFGTCVIRLGWIYTVFPMIGTYRSLLIIYPISWIITGILVFSAYIIVSRKVYSKANYHPI